MSDDAQWLKLVDVLHAEGLDSLSRQRNWVEQQLTEFSKAYTARAASFPPGILPKTVTLKELLDEHARNPHRVRPILQGVAFGCSAQMLVMMWLVLLGSTIEELEYKYERKQLSQLTVKLRLPDHITDVTPPFVSDEHWDFNVLKLAGTSKTGDKPTIESFYSLRILRPST